MRGSSRQTDTQDALQALAKGWKHFQNYRAEPTLAKFHQAGQDIRKGVVDKKTGKKLSERKNYVRCVMGCVGCLDADTEVMTPNGWVRIADWERGTPILEWDGECGTFRKPLLYHVYEADDLISFKVNKFLEMVVSDEHRVPLLRDGKLRVKLAADLALHPSRWEIPTTWVPGNAGVDMTDEMLRLWVAIAADGHYPKAGQQCIFTLRKKRKIERLRLLLAANNIDYDETVYHTRGEETAITFRRPDLPKHLSWKLALANRHQAEVVMEEMPHWDGLSEHDYDRFSGTNKQDADIIQYLSHCAGRKATMKTVRRHENNENWSDIYEVYPAKLGSPKNRVFMREGTRVERVPTVDGKKYCFTTTTGFFVARKNDAIFITGNSGKSVACCIEIMLRAIQQPAGPDGVRRSRIAIVRDTYKNLKDTTLQTWLAWFPEGTVSHVNWTPPISVQMGVELPNLMPGADGKKRYGIPLEDGTTVELELKCLGLENGEKAMEDLKSLELTGAWVNECQAIRLPLINQLIQRVGRYPGGNDDPEKKSISYVIMDTNPPNIGNWYHELAEKKHPEGWTFWKQPPALLRTELATGEVTYEPNVGQREGIPPAENISHHSEGWDYYLKGVGSQSDEFTRVFMCGEYGDTSGGKPVYMNYKDAVHYVDAEIEQRRGAPIILGFDYGLTPACAICQINERGQVQVLEEVIGDNIGIKGFFEQQLRPRLINDYGWGAGLSLYAVGDPAGNSRKDTDESTAAGVLRQFGIPVVPCLTNANSARIESVRTLLSRYADGRTPDLRISNKCPVLREGFLGNYRYATIKGLNITRLREVPEKNEYSHIHDALQYACHMILNPGLYDISFRGGQRPVSSVYSGSGASTKIVDLSGFC